MAQIILNCRYIKGGASGALKENLVEYIGTREGVELNFDDETGNSTATEKQKDLILKLTDELPNIQELFDYEEFICEPTKANASRLITAAFDYNFDLITGKSNLVEYIGKRPMVDKTGEHGLFTVNNSAVDINVVMKEVAEHKGNIWTNVLSLRRDDAERLGYNSQQAWKNLLTSQLSVLSQNIGIPIDKLNVYAAFHNQSHHPHCHFIMYSTEPTGGHLNAEGIMNIKSGFANEVFRGDMYHIYNQKTTARDELKKVSQKKMFELMEQLQNGNVENPDLEKRLIAISERLKTVKGKKVYGYLPKDIKEDINSIVNELEKDTRIAELYKTWYDMQTAVIKVYKDDVPPMKPLSACEDFKRIKNMIIEEALKIDLSNIVGAHSVESDTVAGRMEYISGKAYFTGDGVRKDIQKAVRLLEESADAGNQHAQYFLGKAYYFGIEVKEDRHKAHNFLTSAAKQDNQGAIAIINYRSHGNHVLRLLNHLGKLIYEEMEDRKHIKKTDKKTIRKMIEKKETQGQKMR